MWFNWQQTALNLSGKKKTSEEGKESLNDQQKITNIFSKITDKKSSALVFLVGTHENQMLNNEKQMDQ